MPASRGPLLPTFDGDESLMTGSDDSGPIQPSNIRINALPPRPRLVDAGQQKRADQGLRLSGAHDRLHGGILSSSINRHDDEGHPLTHCPHREMGARDGDGEPCIESCWNYARAHSLTHFATSPLSIMCLSLTPLTVPRDETCNHLACWQPRCVWPAKVSLPSLARRQEGNDSVVYCVCRISGLDLDPCCLGSIDMPSYLNMGLLYLSHANHIPTASIRYSVCDPSKHVRIRELGVECRIHGILIATLISNTNHNIDHQRNHPCDAQNAIASPHLHPIAFSTTHIIRLSLKLVKSGCPMIG